MFLIPLAVIIVTLMIFNQPSFFWFFLLSSLIIAASFIGRESSDRSLNFSIKDRCEAIFPQKLYRKTSAKIDNFGFSIIALGMIFFITSQAFDVFAFVRSYNHIFLTELIGQRSSVASKAPTFIANLAYTFSLLIAYDIAFFIHHICHHRIKFLWRFHEVHHSAEALVPMTTFRLHPVEVLALLMLASITTGIVQGCFDYWFGNSMTLLTIAGINAFLFIFYMCGYHLRHSHIAVSYNHWFSHVFISPLQHQVHHSHLPQHTDKNYGLVFALWDWGIGSLYIPGNNEEIELGLNPSSNHSGQQSLVYWLLHPIKINWLEYRLMTLLYLVLLLALIAI